MPQLTLLLFGGFRAGLDVGPPVALPAKAQALLAYLAVRPGVAHPRDKLAALLWGDTGEVQARRNLRHTLFAIRKLVGSTTPPALCTDGRAVALEPAALDVDVLTFEQLVTDGTPETLQRAAALYRGELLDGLSIGEPPFEDWLLAERERLRELALEALARLLAHQSRSRATEPAIRTALGLLALDPLEEAVHRALMRLYARQGRRGAALRQYQACIDLLQRQLGVEPEPETQQLYQEILRQRTPPPPAVDAPAARNAPLGRKAELGRLREVMDGAWRGHEATAMVGGEPGIGKTPLVEEPAHVHPVPKLQDLLEAAGASQKRLASAFQRSRRLVLETLTLLKQGVAEADSMSLRPTSWLWVANLGDRLDEADQVVRRALELSRQHNERDHQA